MHCIAVNNITDIITNTRDAGWQKKSHNIVLKNTGYLINVILLLFHMPLPFLITPACYLLTVVVQRRYRQLELRRNLPRRVGNNFGISTRRGKWENTAPTTLFTALWHWVEIFVLQEGRGWKENPFEICWMSELKAHKCVCVWEPHSLKYVFPLAHKHTDFIINYNNRSQSY